MNPGVSPWPLDTKGLFPELAPSSDTPGAGEQRGQPRGPGHTVLAGWPISLGLASLGHQKFHTHGQNASAQWMHSWILLPIPSRVTRCHMPPCATCPAVGTGPMCGADASPTGAPRQCPQNCPGVEAAPAGAARQRPQSCPHTRREGRGERAGAAPWRPRRPSNHLPPGRGCGFKMADGERPGEAV